MLRLFPEAALKFYLTDQYSVLFAPRDKDHGELWNTVLRLGLGLTTAVVTTVAVYPLDLAATRLAADRTERGGVRVYKGVTDTLHLTYRKEGLRGPWKGLTAAALANVPFYAVNIQAYFWLTSLLPASTEAKKSAWYAWAKMGAGGASGALATLAAYPLDTLRRRGQVFGAIGFAGQDERPRGPLGTAARVLREEGARGLFRGCGVAVVRAVPASLLHFTLYDLLRSGAVYMAPPTAPSL